VSSGRCDAAVAELASAPAISRMASHLELNPTLACDDIARRVQRDHGSRVEELKPGARPVSVNIGKLRKPSSPSAAISGMPGEVYFVIALTRLEKSNGWHHFFERSDEALVPYSSRKEETVDLDPGHAVIRMGECEGRRGEGEGGMMLVITYR